MGNAFWMLFVSHAIIPHYHHEIQGRDWRSSVKHSSAPVTMAGYNVFTEHQTRHEHGIGRTTAGRISMIIQHYDQLQEILRNPRIN